MVNSVVKRKAIMDWRAAIWAGLLAGVFFFILSAGMTLMLGGSLWGLLRYTASLVLGEGVLPPPSSFDPLVVLVALLVHFVLSVLYACILAFIIHRGGLLAGIIGGALFGLALYAINYYTFSFFFPWFFSLRSWMVVAAHVLFGAIAGGVYEALERDRYITVEEEAHG